MFEKYTDRDNRAYAGLQNPMAFSSEVPKSHKDMENVQRLEGCAS